MTIDSKTILIVDDEPSICDILEKFLKKKGYKIQLAHDGKIALDLIKNNQIDLVVSDIKMPGMSGVELLQKIREYNRSMPVLMTTGFPTIDTAIEALKHGAYDYLTKPFHLEEIAEKIRRALVQQQLEEENILFSKLVSLHEVTKILASTLDSADLHFKFMDFSMRIVKADGGAIMLYDNAGRLTPTQSAGPGISMDFWLTKPFLLAAEWVSKNQEPLVIEAGMKDFPAGLMPIPADIESYIAFPLKTPTHTIGLLNLVRMRGRESFSNLDLELINVLASQASITIENVKLYHNIRNNYLETIRAFALAVEAKDEYTHGHSENVMKFTVMIAERLRLPVHELELIKYAGLLHDIGKIGVSEFILNKPGKLTQQEFQEIKRHPELGAHIIADVPFLKSLVPLVLHHHEFWNGGGYPQGISGEQIPYGARILAVSDAFEAMTSDRPYRKAMPQEVAFNILIAQKGLQFDPAIVDVFLEIMKSTKQPV